MKKWDIVNKDGYSAIICNDDGSDFKGFDTRDEAEMVLDRMVEIDWQDVIENDWHIEVIEVKRDFGGLALIGLFVFYACSEWLCEVICG